MFRAWTDTALEVSDGQMFVGLVKQEKGEEECHVARAFLVSTWKGPPALHSTSLRALCLLLMKTVAMSSAFGLMPQSPFLTYSKGTMAEVPWEGS